MAFRSSSARERLRTRHYSYRTEQQYISWTRRFILFHGKRHPAELTGKEVEAFLNHLANARHVSASTQNQALAALLFLYKEVLGIRLPWLDGVVRAKKPQHLPVVLSARELRMVLGRLDGIPWLVASLLYGSGLRLIEALRLRVKDIDFEYRQIVVRDGKGGKDRITVLPSDLESPLRRQLERVRDAHIQAMRDGFGGTEPPFAIDRKYPTAGRVARPQGRRDDADLHARDAPGCGRRAQSLGRDLGFPAPLSSLLTADVQALRECPAPR